MLVIQQSEWGRPILHVADTIQSAEGPDRERGDSSVTLGWNILFFYCLWTSVLQTLNLWAPALTLQALGNLASDWKLPHWLPDFWDLQTWAELWSSESPACIQHAMRRFCLITKWAHLHNKSPLTCLSSHIMLILSRKTVIRMDKLEACKTKRLLKCQRWTETRREDWRLPRRRWETV